MSPRQSPATATVGDVVITNADKVWWPDEGITKADIARYYARVADRLLPWIADRALTVERCPDGMRGRCFYQPLPQVPGQAGQSAARRHRVA